MAGVSGGPFGQSSLAMHNMDAAAMMKTMNQMALNPTPPRKCRLDETDDHEFWKGVVAAACVGQGRLSGWYVDKRAPHAEGQIVAGITKNNGDEKLVRLPFPPGATSTEEVVSVIFAAVKLGCA